MFQRLVSDKTTTKRSEIYSKKEDPYAIQAAHMRLVTAHPAAYLEEASEARVVVLVPRTRTTREKAWDPLWLTT